MTHAELCLHLISLRIQPRGHQRDPRRPIITDKQWKDWTGLSPRAKDTAAQGLREKGLDVAGEGKDAEYRFDRSRWEQWLRCAPREKARSAGRKVTVSAKPDQQIHPECRERGCQKLCEGEQSKGCEVVSITSAIATKHQESEQPVAQPEPPERTNLSGPERTNPSGPGKQPVAQPSPDLGQPVAQAFPWERSLRAIQKWFPHTDSDFVMHRLLPVCQAKSKRFTDEQLAQAIAAAKTRTQTGEGLFLRTVPGHLAVILSQPQIPGTGIPSTPSPESIREHLDTFANALSHAGFSAEARQVSTLDETELLHELEECLTEVEAAVVKTLRNRHPVGAFKNSVQRDLERYRGRMTREQVERLEQQLIDRKLLEGAKIPRLTLSGVV